MLTIVWSILIVNYLIKEKEDSKSFTLKYLYGILFDSVFSLTVIFGLYYNFPNAIEQTFSTYLVLIYRTIFIIILWILYFHISKRVKNTYSETKSSSIYIMGSYFIIISVILSVIGSFGSSIYELDYYSGLEELIKIEKEIDRIDKEWEAYNCDESNIHESNCNSMATEYNYLLKIYNQSFNNLESSYPYYFE